MKQKRPTRVDAHVLTAGTGDDILGDESSVASDIAIHSSEATSQSIVGRTAFDLLHEQGITAALARIVLGMDAVEVLGTVAFILLDLFGKTGVPVMRFWVFVSLLAGYHIVLKPLAEFIRILVENYRVTHMQKPPAL